MYSIFQFYIFVSSKKMLNKKYPKKDYVYQKLEKNLKYACSSKWIFGIFYGEAVKKIWNRKIQIGFEQKGDF